VASPKTNFALNVRPSVTNQSIFFAKFLFGYSERYVFGIMTYKSQSLLTLLGRCVGNTFVITASYSKSGALGSDLRVEFLLKTDGGYNRDAEVSLFTLANPGSSLRFNTPWSAPIRKLRLYIYVV